VTVVTVTAGKPTELAFKLSKLSKLPLGAITFKVTNAGAVSHNFKLCTKPVTSSTANSCVGKVTPTLASGKSATLTVTLTKSGTYEFLCAVPGHAGAGMKGLLGVGVAVSAAASVAGSTSSSSNSTSSGSTSTGTTSGGSTGAGAASATSTTYPTGNAASGKSIFNSAGCAGCHALAAAGSPDGDGPPLDGTKLSIAAVEAQVASGGGAMPAFRGSLSAQQIADVSTFVSQSSQ